MPDLKTATLDALYVREVIMSALMREQDEEYEKALAMDMYLEHLEREATRSSLPHTPSIADAGSTQESQKPQSQKSQSQKPPDGPPTQPSPSQSSPPSPRLSQEAMRRARLAFFTRSAPTTHTLSKRRRTNTPDTTLILPTRLRPRRPHPS